MKSALVHKRFCSSDHLIEVVEEEKVALHVHAEVKVLFPDEGHASADGRTVADIGHSRIGRSRCSGEEGDVRPDSCFGKGQDAEGGKIGEPIADPGKLGVEPCSGDVFASSRIEIGDVTTADFGGEPVVEVPAENKSEAWFIISADFAPCGLVRVVIRLGDSYDEVEIGPLQKPFARWNGLGGCGKEHDERAEGDGHHDAHDMRM